MLLIIPNLKEKGHGFSVINHNNADKECVFFCIFMGLQGDLCCHLVSDPILGYSVLTPCYLTGLTSWI